MRERARPKSVSSACVMKTLPRSRKGTMQRPVQVYWLSVHAVHARLPRDQRGQEGCQIQRSVGQRCQPGDGGQYTQVSCARRASRYPRVSNSWPVTRSRARLRGVATRRVRRAGSAPMTSAISTPRTNASGRGDEPRSIPRTSSAAIGSPVSSSRSGSASRPATACGERVTA